MMALALLSYRDHMCKSVGNGVEAEDRGHAV
jgi:hypothetical protein